MKFDIWKKRKQGANTTAGHWLKEQWLNPITTKGANNDIVKLSSVKRAVSNFVTLCTGKNIPVKYSSKGESYTDGHSVVLSGDITDDKNFDPMCGLALHEGSHILLSSFDLLQSIKRNPTKYLKKEIAFLKKKYKIDADKATKYALVLIPGLFNWVEDRRIDNHIYTTAPGYRGYYDAMYDKYFYAEEIDDLLKSNEGRNENWDCYLIRIINILNPNTDVNALKGLQEILDVLDIDNISRMKKTMDALEVAKKIFAIVEKYVTTQTNKKEKQQGEGEEGEGEDGEGKELSDEEFEQLMKNIKPGGEGGSGKGGTPIKLTDAQRKKLAEMLQKQKQFVKGNVKKQKVDASTNQQVEAVDSGKVEYKETGKMNPKNGNGSTQSTKTVIVHQFTSQFAQNDPFSVLAAKGDYSFRNNEENIIKGMRLGKILGNKLQIRNDERTTKYNRLNSGKIDKRLINSLGYGNEAVFNQLHIDNFNPVLVHLSLDASGSMQGSKWANTLCAVAAICTAANMVKNLDVVIDMRTTSNSTGKHVPVCIITYDSRRDSFKHVKTMLPYMDCKGATPEGLCFEAIEKYMSEDKNKDQYFINFSDGEPYFNSNELSYGGDYARNHTRQQVKNIRMKGYNILSYLISDYGDDIEQFKQMYGNDACNIDVTQIVPLSKTLNKLFLNKKQN